MLILFALVAMSAVMSGQAKGGLPLKLISCQQSLGDFDGHHAQLVHMILHGNAATLSSDVQQDAASQYSREIFSNRSLRQMIDREIAKNLTQKRPILRMNENIVVITHQNNELQKLSVNLIDGDGVLKHAPRLVLASPLFPILSHEFLNAAEAVRFSSSGELPVMPRAKNYHLMGGYAEACLANSIKSIIQKFLKSRQKELRLTLYSQFIYTGDGKVNEATLASVLGSEVELEEFMKEQRLFPPKIKEIMVDGQRVLRYQYRLQGTRRVINMDVL